MSPLILSVDDDEHALYLIKYILNSTEAEVVQASNGEQALDILESMTPDVLLLDLLMPRVTGWDILKFIAATPRLDNMQVIIVSVHRDLAALRDCTRANDHVFKPFLARDLRAAVKKSLTSTSQSSK